MDATGISIVISGSFRRYLTDIQQLIYECELLGIAVLSPKRSAPVDPSEEFVILELDPTDNPKALEELHLAAIAKAHCLYVCNTGGYIGLSTALEIGWALALKKPVFTTSLPGDKVFQVLTHIAPAPKDVIKYLARRNQ